MASMNEQYGKHIFEAGDSLVSEENENYSVVSFLGRGGQGEVYRVSGPKGAFALKWYYKDDFLRKVDVDLFYLNLKRNIEDGIPSLSSGDLATQFIWPRILMKPYKGSFGYLMKLFPDGYEPLSHVILGRKRSGHDGSFIPVRWLSWFTRITAALNIVRAFEILHASGKSYQDVNEGGFCVNIQTGDVFIGDCDNVSPDRMNIGIRGMRTFMAPEIVRGEALPNRYTDEYSLAVILFRMFFYGHPLIGKESHAIRSDISLTAEEADTIIFGKAPHYCLASKNNVNPVDPRKDPDVFRMSLTYPTILMDAFEKVFTSGIMDPQARLTATEWRNVLLAVRDRLIISNNQELFVQTRVKKQLPEECTVLQYKDGRKIYCAPGKILYGYHIDQYNKDYRTPVGKIISTNQKNVLGLYNANCGNIHYVFEHKQGICHEKGRMPLLRGMYIKLAKEELIVC